MFVYFVSSKEFLDIQTTIECGFTLKRVYEMIRTYRHFKYLATFAARFLECV